MTSPQSVPSDYCRHCGASLKPGATQCWMCHSDPRASTVGEIAGEAASPPAAHLAARSEPFQYGLSSLMAIVTLVAVLCSITAMVPGLGIALIILAVPALVRTSISAWRRHARGESMSVGGKAAMFLATMGMIITVIIAAGGAFFFTCLATWGLGGAKIDGPNAESVIALALLLGGIAGLAAAIGVGLLFWKVLRRRQSR